MSQYVLGSDAVLDLEEIWDYIAADSTDAADRWIAKLFDAIERIADMPGVGHRREDLTAYPVLFWPVGTYLIISTARNRAGRSRLWPSHKGRGTSRHFYAGACTERKAPRWAALHKG